jgi:hypothetical protein
VDLNFHDSMIFWRISRTKVFFEENQQPTITQLWPAVKNVATRQQTRLQELEKESKSLGLFWIPGAIGLRKGANSRYSGYRGVLNYQIILEVYSLISKDLALMTKLQSPHPERLNFLTVDDIIKRDKKVRNLYRA